MMAVRARLIYNPGEAQYHIVPINHPEVRVPFKTLLKELVSSVEGATGAIFLASDGEAVQWYSNDDGERLQLRGAYITVALRGCRALADRLTPGSIRHLVLEYDSATFIVQELDRGYFVVLELDSSANIGQALYRTQPVVAHLCREIAV
jgi:predicted regulator of Ras-like GTPase activity (Roadblock/LC7/MglB family)